MARGAHAAPTLLEIPPPTTDDPSPGARATRLVHVLRARRARFVIATASSPSLALTAGHCLVGQHAATPTRTASGPKAENAFPRRPVGPRADRARAARGESGPRTAWTWMLEAQLASAEGTFRRRLRRAGPRPRLAPHRTPGSPDGRPPSSATQLLEEGGSLISTGTRAQARLDRRPQGIDLHPRHPVTPSRGRCRISRTRPSDPAHPSRPLHVGPHPFHPLESRHRRGPRRIHQGGSPRTATAVWPWSSYSWNGPRWNPTSRESWSRSRIAIPMRSPCASTWPSTWVGSTRPRRCWPRRRRSPPDLADSRRSRALAP